MAAGRRTLLLALFLLLFARAWSNTFTICNNTGITTNLYERRPGSNYCYRLFQTNTDFSSANRSCVRQNGYLVKIDSGEENSYIMETYFTANSNQDFWIGLTDQDDEGAFRWVKGNNLLLPNISYTNWFVNSAASTNTESFDCVKFTADGWKVHQHFCDSSRLTYLCRQGVCNSDDGLTCVQPIANTGAAVSPVIIAVIVVIVVILIIVVVVTVLLLWLWKYHNDKFYRYILCCVYGGSKTQINNLKQENIRLRKELSQQKLNLNTSGRFQGQMSRQSSQTVVSTPLSPDPHTKMLPNRSFSFVSNKVAPVTMSPQTSVAALPRMGRSFSTTSGTSLTPIRTPLNTRPILPSVKETPISEEVFPESTKQDDRPSSADSGSSSSSSSGSTRSSSQKKKQSDTVTDSKEEKNTKNVIPSTTT